MGVATAAVVGAAVVGAAVTANEGKKNRRAAQRANDSNYAIAMENIEAQKDHREFLENTEQKRILADKSPLQQQLEQGSLQNYQQQQLIQNQIEQNMNQAQGLQNQGQQTLSGILSGEAFGPTAQEQQMVDATRNADLAIGQSQIDGFLNDRLNQLQADAASRGVRGQAYSQLQGQALGNAANLLQQRVLDANKNAANQQMQMTQNRVGLQGQIGTNSADFANVLQQRAFQNRQALQNPMLLQQLQNERLATATTKGFAGGSAAPINTFQAQAMPQGPSPVAGAMAGAGSAINMMSGMKGLG